MAPTKISGYKITGTNTIMTIVFLSRKTSSISFFTSVLIILVFIPSSLLNQS